jgi:predicted acetyltransferase
MKVINLFGGPGVGKSTVAARVFTALKQRHLNAELAREYAKDAVWSRNLNTLKDQVHILGEQHHRIWILDGQCDYVVCDGPILLGCIYNRFYGQYTQFDALAIECHNHFDNLNYFLSRSPVAFNEKGRVETEAKAIEIDDMLTGFLLEQNIPFRMVNHDNAVDEILGDVL